MKKITFLILALVSAAFLVLTTGCEKAEGQGSTDYGRTVAGVYTGKLLYGTEIIEDAYVVRLNRVSSTVVTMYADFFGDDLCANFNISREGNVYSLYSATVYNMTTTVSGKQITINYLTTGGNMYTFSGAKD